MDFFYYFDLENLRVRYLIAFRLIVLLSVLYDVHTPLCSLLQVFLFYISSFLTIYLQGSINFNVHYFQGLDLEQELTRIRANSSPYGLTM